VYFLRTLRLKLKGFYQATDNNMGTIMFSAPSVEVAKGLAASPELKEAMKAAGVISAPEFKILTSMN